MTPWQVARAHVPTPRCQAHTMHDLWDRQDRVLAHRQGRVVPRKMGKWERRVRRIIEWPLLKMAGKSALSAAILLGIFAAYGVLA